ncbi:MAG TPA: NifB/NifX family molybdenum-iron cluster-binding protein [Bdellovibrionota bacterium]|nr:NifB/NifX family molybdenum-iron cluster-binding protein [Bdellovibrionota bacterium]
MNICIPIDSDQGLLSRVCQHFGSAPAFLILDADSLQYTTIINTKQHHGHGGCHPLAVLSGQNIQSLVVSGIGMGALQKCQAAKIRVYRSTTGTVQDIVKAFKSGTLSEVSLEDACAHHGETHGHCQGHGH